MSCSYVITSILVNRYIYINIYLYAIYSVNIFVNITDFDKAYEFLTVYINGKYLGICEGRGQDIYNAAYLCFEGIDISQYTGEYPTHVNIKVKLEITVDRNWLDAGVSPYLLDSSLKLFCEKDKKDQHDLFYGIGDGGIQFYDARHDIHNNGTFTHVRCQTIDCKGTFTYMVNGECLIPVLSFYYFANHFEDSLVDIYVNNTKFGHCGPTESSDIVNTVIFTGPGGVSFEARICFEELSIYELMNEWNSGNDHKNEFTIGTHLRDVNELDDIRNSTVAQMFFVLNCNDDIAKNMYSNREMYVNMNDVNGTFIGFGCVHAGCQAQATFKFNVGNGNITDVCQVPLLDLSFYLTDFKLETEYLTVYINDKIYGKCDGSKDGELDTIYNCLKNADILNWINNNNDRIVVRLVASSHVDGLDSTKNGMILNANAGIKCVSISPTVKHQNIIIDNNQVSHQVNAQCQGLGCESNVYFNIIGDNECFKPRLSVSFWLTDFLTFDEYVDVLINGVNIERCYGGSDDVDILYECFKDKDIRYYISNYEYNTNNDNDIEYNKLDINATLHIKLMLSSNVDWLDHSHNDNLLDSIVKLTCNSRNEFHNTIGDNTTTDVKHIVNTKLLIQKVDIKTIQQYYNELQTRFEYVLKAMIHYFPNNTITDNTIPFYVYVTFDSVHDEYTSILQVYISCNSFNEANYISQLINQDIFLFIYQETLRDSHFKHSSIDSIIDTQLIIKMPPTYNPTPSPTLRPTIKNNDTNELTPILKEDLNTEIKTLIKNATMTDILTLIGVITIFLCICGCCIGVLVWISNNQKKSKVIRNIHKYKQQVRSFSIDDSNEHDNILENDTFLVDDNDQTIGYSFQNPNIIKTNNKSHDIKKKRRRVSKGLQLKREVEMVTTNKMTNNKKRKPRRHSSPVTQNDVHNLQLNHFSSTNSRNSPSMSTPNSLMISPITQQITQALPTPTFLQYNNNINSNAGHTPRRFSYAPTHSQSNTPIHSQNNTPIHLQNIHSPITINNNNNNNALINKNNYETGSLRRKQMNTKLQNNNDSPNNSDFDQKNNYIIDDDDDLKQDIIIKNSKKKRKRKKKKKQFKVDTINEDGTIEPNNNNNNNNDNNSDSNDDTSVVESEVSVLSDQSLKSGSRHSKKSQGL